MSASANDAAIKKSLSNFVRSRLGEGRKLLSRNLVSAARLLGISATKKADLAPYLSRVSKELDHGVHQLEVGGSIRTLEINRAGVARVNGGNLLEIDYGVAEGLWGWGPHRRMDRCVHLWSHRWLGYYHWLIDVGPKICAVQAVYGRDLGGYKLCWPKIGRPYEEQLIALLDVPAELAVNTHDTGGISASSLVCLPLPPLEAPPLPRVRLLRDRLAYRLAAQGGDKVFITRSGARACLNETEMFAELARHDFRVVDFNGMSVAEQMRLMSSAAAVGGIHGAGLANILWCHPGTVVIDLLPPGYQPAWYANLSEALGLRYHRVLAQTQTPDDQHWTQSGDAFVVDTANLRVALDGIFQ